MKKSNVIKDYKITSKGQVTLPAQLRDKLGNPTSVRFLETKDGVQILPVVEERWETLYEAKKNSKGIDGKDFLEMLKAG